jgi:hypothetical protein
MPIDSRSPDPNAILDPLPASILFDIARNESASEEWRKAAVKLLRKKGFKQAQHPELAFIVQALEKEELAEKEVIAVVEAATEEELSEDPEVDDGFKS